MFATRFFIITILIILWWHVAPAQFREDFNSPVSPEDKGWTFATGDGTVDMKFVQGQGFASVLIDATADKRNLWWALIRREIKEIDVDLLSKPNYEIRSEARIRVSHAPRRVNLHFNHQRTTDFHSHLMEYDIPDSTEWHVISLTTKNFEVQPGDRINAQMALMDWGQRIFQVDIDYFKVDVVRSDTVGPDLGRQLPYHPPLEEPGSFSYHVPVQENAMLDTQYPDVNFKHWTLVDSPETGMLHVGGSQLVILRWDLSELKDRKIARSGLLELPVHSVQRSSDYTKDFGMVRISEIIGGQPAWTQQDVTLDSFGGGKVMPELINEQMTLDYEILIDHNGSAFFTISYPVLQRLIDGLTLGLAIKPLGAVSATFFSSGVNQKETTKLHFDLEE